MAFAAEEILTEFVEASLQGLPRPRCLEEALSKEIAYQRAQTLERYHKLHASNPVWARARADKEKERRNRLRGGPPRPYSMHPAAVKSRRLRASKKKSV